MRIATLTGTLLSAATLIFMGTIGVQAYNKDQYTSELLEFNRKAACLAENIYHEAKSESELGMRAVGYVTLNRAKDPRYPDDVCDVVYQAVLDSNGVPKKNKCQFSWYCDGKPDEVADLELYREAHRVASIVITIYGNSFDPTMGATMYHADYVDPNWADHFEVTTQIENHVFYRDSRS